MPEVFLFVIFGAVAVAGGVAVVIARNPVYGAMGLMMTLFSLAVFYVTQLAHFVAAVQVIVYAGAVMTLFLFVIMLIGVDKAESTAETLPYQRIIAGSLGAAVLVGGLFLLIGGRFSWVIPEAGPEANGTVEAVSRTLWPDGGAAGWVLPFEVTSLLLVIAAVGALALAFFRPLVTRGTAPLDDELES